jgi:hypothetical protein
VRYEITAPTEDQVTRNREFIDGLRNGIAGIHDGYATGTEDYISGHNTARELLSTSFKPDHHPTPEELELVGDVRTVVFNELRLYEDDAFVPQKVPRESYKFYSSEKYQQINPVADSLGASLNPYGLIALNHGRLGISKLQTAVTLVHETLEASSYFDLKAHTGSDGRQKIRSNRQAFQMNMDSQDPLNQHFKMFREAIIEDFTREIVLRNKTALHLDDLSDQELTVRHTAMNGYSDYFEVLYTVAEGIAHSRGNVSQADVIQEFRQACFNGKIQDLLIEIEKTFGNGSLRVLAAMGTGVRDKSYFDHMIEKNGLKPETFFEKIFPSLRRVLPRKEVGSTYDTNFVNNQIKRFFQASDKTEKDRIAQRILAPQNLEKYTRRASK